MALKGTKTSRFFDNKGSSKSLATIVHVALTPAPMAVETLNSDTPAKDRQKTSVSEVSAPAALEDTTAGTPVKTKGVKKRVVPAASEIHTSDETLAKRSKPPSIFHMLASSASKLVDAKVTPEIEPKASVTASCGQSADPPTAMALAATASKPAAEPTQSAESSTDPASPMELVVDPTPSSEPPTHSPAPTNLDAVLEDGGTQSYDFKVGEVSYTCVCTRDPTAANAWAESLAQEVNDSTKLPGSVVTILGVDCEWAAPWHRGPDDQDRVATLQLFHHGLAGRRALVFRVAGLGGELPTAIVGVLSDPRIAKLGVNVAGDASRLVRDFGGHVKGLYDLCKMASKAGQKLRKSVSLEDIVRATCPSSMHISKSDAMLTKGVRTSNWEAWPLSTEQVEYAAKDAALAVLAFTHKFNIDDHQLSKEASEVLVDLEDISNESITQADSASGKACSNGEDDPDSNSAATKTKSNKADSASEEKSSKGEDDFESNGAETKSKGKGKGKANKANFFMAMRNSIISPPNLGNKEHPVGPKNALANVCVVVSGILDSFERADMEKYVKDHGGKVSKSVTSKVTHLVTDHGEAGPSKLAKCKEFGIPTVSEDVILDIVRNAI